MPNQTNTLELNKTQDGATKAVVDGRVEPGRLDLAALRRTVGRSERARIWSDRPAVIVDQVGNEVRWKVWEDGAWRVLWFLRSDYAAQVLRFATTKRHVA